MKFKAWLVLLLLFPSPDFAGPQPPIPPAFPGGFADAWASLAFVAGEKGQVEALDLASGQVRWASSLGQWPLFTRFGLLAVASAEPRRASALRLRFLNPQDGKLRAEALPLSKPGWFISAAQALANESGLFFQGPQGSTEFSTWSAPPLKYRPAGPHGGWMQLHWKTVKFQATGIQPRRGLQSSSGFFLLNPMDGRAEEIAAKDAWVPPAPPELPVDWKPKTGWVYWGGGAWTSRPRPFWTGSGMTAVLAWETGPGRRLVLERWRPFEPLAAVELEHGAEYAPRLGLDGRYLLLSIQSPGKEDWALYDLATVAKTRGPLAKLPALEAGFQPAFTVLGPHLFYLVEQAENESGGGTLYQRTLVCLDWTQGRVAWQHVLAPRHENPPIP